MPFHFVSFISLFFFRFGKGEKYKKVKKTKNKLKHAQINRVKDEGRRKTQ
jgi:hypothetical protein